MMMKLLITIALAVALLAGTVAANCGEAPNIDECYKLIRAQNMCVFDKGQCIDDPCKLAMSADDCSATDPKCIYTPWLPAACNHRYFMCASIVGTEACNLNPLCAMEGSNCLYSVPTSYNTAAPKESECPGFPVWSIALLVVWILMLVIFVVIILIVRKKPLTRSIEESAISIEGVGNKDHFTSELDEPFR